MHLEKVELLDVKIANMDALTMRLPIYDCLQACEKKNNKQTYLLRFSIQQKYDEKKSPNFIT